MARITMRYQSIHPDGTVCEHRLTTRGSATEDGCTGRDHWRAACSCGTKQTAPLKVVLKPKADAHLRDHRTARVLPNAFAGRRVVDLPLP
jgi:hypothetical protein